MALKPKPCCGFLTFFGTLYQLPTKVFPQKRPDFMHFPDAFYGFSGGETVFMLQKDLVKSVNVVKNTFSNLCLKSSGNLHYSTN